MSCDNPLIHHEAHYININNLLHEDATVNRLQSQILDGDTHKSILKRPLAQEYTENIKSYIACSLALLTYLPFIILDLYYGYTNQGCLYKNMLLNSTLNVKMYLLVSGYSILAILLVTLIANYSCLETIKNQRLGRLRTIITLFIATWAVIGATVFWSKSHNKYGDLCGSGVATYISVSISIKLILIFLEIVCHAIRNGIQTA